MKEVGQFHSVDHPDTFHSSESCQYGSFYMIFGGASLFLTSQLGLHPKGNLLSAAIYSDGRM